MWGGEHGGGLAPPAVNKVHKKQKQELKVTRKKTRNPDPSVRANQPRFSDLDRASQNVLAAWAVILKSFPPVEGERVDHPSDWYGRAVGEISLTVGLRSRKQMNYPDLYRGRRFRSRNRSVG